MNAGKDAAIESVLGIACYGKLQLEFLWGLCQEVVAIPGDAAEIGVFRGGTAKLIAEAMPNKDIHLFDTFNGMPKQWEPQDGTYFTPYTYKPIEDHGALVDCKKLLGNRHGLHFYVGVFPQTVTPEVADRSFAFVHVDCDLKRSIYDSLMWFWPRMRKGGLVVVHDVFGDNTPGVIEALKAFSWQEQTPFNVFMFYRMAIVKKP